MIVFLVRHADAVDETRALVDAHRHLSAAGRQAAAELGRRLRWYDCTPTAVYASPLVRTMQTAELLVAALEWQGVVESLPSLAPGGDFHAVQALLDPMPVDASVIFVGHEPGISGLGQVLTKLPRFPALQKAQAVRIVHGTPRWWFGHADEAPTPWTD